MVIRFRKPCTLIECLLSLFCSKIVIYRLLSLYFGGPSSDVGGGLCTGGCNSFFLPGFSFLSISGAGTRKRLKVKLFTHAERADWYNLFEQVRIKHR